VPTYEYSCDACEATFEELHLSRSEAEKHSKEYPCPGCGVPAPRVPSASNFQFAGKAGSDPTSGRSSSGSHDLDYPSLDKAVGRSANRRWKAYEPRKEARDAVRKETKSVAISDTRDGGFVPTDQATLKAREAGLKMFKKARESGG